MLRAILLMALMFSGAVASAAPWPTVTSVAIEGNRVTRESVILRELALAPGDPADPSLIEASRQAVLDLGLFRAVEIETRPQSTGVALRVRVDERRYVLPIPRIETSSDRDVSYGGQLRWSNVGGRNHSLHLTVERGRFPDDRLREREEGARISYSAPYFLGSAYQLSASAERIERQTPSPEGGYDQTLERAQVLAIRDFTRGRPRHGWRVGGGLYRHDQTTAGPFAPPPDGAATALVGIADYSDLRYRVFSEEGRRLTARVEWAPAGSGDYAYRQFFAHAAQYRAIGDRDHQSLHLIAEGGFREDGPRSRNAFFLGGSSRLRGYPSQYLGGERFYRLSAEYLRPLRWDWLRLLAVAELGGTGDDVERRSPGGVHGSVGLGFRIRLSRFVDAEVEFGVAWPLRGGEGPQFFAGGL